MALSHSRLDWDEANFSSAVRDYDVVAHHPHPPGYPLFVAAAKLVRPIASSDFRALQFIALLGAITLFPALVLLGRELGLPQAVTLAAATLTAFIPTVWYYGGTAFSDVPALALAIAGSALMLRGRAYVAGAILVAAAVGIRPQHILIAAPAAILGAIACRNVRTIATAIAAFAITVTIAYAGAAYFSADPPRGYFGISQTQVNFIRSDDSFRDPNRTPLPKLAYRFFIDVVRGGPAGLILVALAAISGIEAIIRRRRDMLIVIAMFLPMAIFSWLMLDEEAVARYGIAYAPMYALLAANLVHRSSFIVW